MDLKNATVYVIEKTNTVLLIFEGFENVTDAYDFSDHLIDELNIKKIHIPENRTLH